MKKTALSTFVIISFLLYSLGLRNSDSPLLVSPRSSNIQGGALGNQGSLSVGGSGSSSGNSSGSGSGSGSGSNYVSAPSQSAKYKDGTYTGSVADAFYGNIQVEAVIKGGKITDVKFLQYPHDQSNSVYINQQAMPYLQQEAIQAQSANVSGVSGATDTSMAFVQSLSVALQQAGV